MWVGCVWGVVDADDADDAVVARVRVRRGEFRRWKWKWHRSRREQEVDSIILFYYCRLWSPIWTLH